MKSPDYSSRGLERHFNSADFRWSPTELVFHRVRTLDADSARAGYASAHFASERESADAATDYLRTFRGVLEKLPRNASCVDIGAGDGAFVRALESSGRSAVGGVEPSRAACQSARSKGTTLQNQSFEEWAESATPVQMLSAFHVLSHATSPRAFVELIAHQIEESGVVLVVDHDAGHWIHRLLGARSPIFDSAHVVLWTRDAMIKVFGEVGFDCVATGPLRNSYRAIYWNSLLPLPAPLKRISSRFLEWSGFAEQRLSWSLGNRWWIFRKRARTGVSHD